MSVTDRETAAHEARAAGSADDSMPQPRESRSRRWHRRLHEQRALSVASEVACRVADEPGAPPTAPVILTDAERRARIEHAMANDLQSWEIAVLIGEAG